MNTVEPKNKASGGATRGSPVTECPEMILPSMQKLRAQNEGLKKLVLWAYGKITTEDAGRMDVYLRDIFLELRHEAELNDCEAAGRADAERELKEALDLLLQVMLKATNDSDDDSYDTIFSHGNGHYANAIRLLTKYDKVKIVKDAPFNLVAREITEKKEEEKRDENAGKTEGDA